MEFGTPNHSGWVVPCTLKGTSWNCVGDIEWAIKWIYIIFSGVFWMLDCQGNVGQQRIPVKAAKECFASFIKRLDILFWLSRRGTLKVNSLWRRSSGSDYVLVYFVQPFHDYTEFSERDRIYVLVSIRVDQEFWIDHLVLSQCLHALYHWGRTHGRE